MYTSATWAAARFAWFSPDTCAKLQYRETISFVRENGGEYIFMANLLIKNTYFVIPQAIWNSSILLIILRTFLRIRHKMICGARQLGYFICPQNWLSLPSWKHILFPFKNPWHNWEEYHVNYYQADMGNDQNTSNGLISANSNKEHCIKQPKN